MAKGLTRADTEGFPKDSIRPEKLSLQQRRRADQSYQPDSEPGIVTALSAKAEKR